MKDKIWLFVLAIRSVDNEIQMFRPESLMAEIKDSQSCSSRQKRLTVHSVICYKTFELIRAKNKKKWLVRVKRRATA